MPKYSSRSRSPRSSERDKKRDHKYKDKKKHRKHSRSNEKKDSRKDDHYSRGDNHRDRKYDRESENGRNINQKYDDKYHQHSSRDKNEGRSNGGNYRNDQKDYHNGSEEQKCSSQRNQGFSDVNSSQVPKKSSRFSDQPIAPPQGNQQQQQNLTRMQMPPPSNVPQKRKKFVWTDAKDEELREQNRRQNLDEGQPTLMFGSNPNLLQNLSPAILSALQDSSKIKKKIYLPKNTGVNYIGLLIGPRGLYQKRLEEESGCKILIRGKGSQKEGSAPQPDDDDEQHVLVIGDSVESVRRAQNAIERVISADDSTRNKIREEQLNVAQQINNQVLPNSQMDDSMMTPYGPPSPYAYIIPVPNDCVGLIIGKGGDTIRQLQMESGAKIQVAKKEIPNSNLRNVFVEGVPEKYQRAREMIEEIIREHRRTVDPQIHVGDVNPFPGPHSKIKVPDKFVGLIIGKNGENLRGIAQRSNTKIFVPQKNNDPGAEDRIIEADGDSQNVEIARQEIYSLIQRYMSQSSSSNFDYTKNPYGSGIAVYNQQKLANDASAINGAVPDSLKPDSGSFASSLLTENPMIAYATMQLTGWSYDDQNNQQNQQQQQEGQEQQQQQQQQYQEGYDQQYYQGYYGNQQYPGAYDQQYPENYYYGQQQYYQQPGDQQADPSQVQNPETASQAQPSTDTQDNRQGGQQPDQQYNYDYSQQYYQNYYGGYAPGSAEYAAWYQQYYGSYPQADAAGAYPQQVQDGVQGDANGQGQPNQQPGQ